MWKKRKECEAVFSKTLPRTKTGYQIIYSIKISKLGLSIYFIKNYFNSLQYVWIEIFVKIVFSYLAQYA